MVHALQEACRVLVPHGLLIDLRPYCLEVALEVVPRQAEFEVAGIMDASLNRDHDEASDRAMETVENEGVIRRIKSDTFDIFYYWSSYRGLMAELSGRWKEDVVLTDEVRDRAQMLYRKHHRRAKLRLRIQSRLVVYEKV